MNGYILSSPEMTRFRGDERAPSQVLWLLGKRETGWSGGEGIKKIIRFFYRYYPRAMPERIHAGILRKRWGLTRPEIVYDPV